MHLSRRLALAATALLLAPAAAGAQAFPSKQIRMIVPFPAGGSVDIAARTLAPILSERLGQTIVIENKAGAAGQLGVQDALKSPPDGHTVVLSTPGASAINMHFRDLGYDPRKDLTAVSILATVPTAIAINNDVPARTLQEFVAFAKGKTELNYSISGVGSQIHLAGELFKSRAGVALQAIPFNGTQPATMALLGGQVQASVSDLSTLLPLGADNKLRILAVVDAKRAAMAPNIPTVAEQGFPDFVASGWVGLFASSATPPAALERWNAEVVRALSQPEIIKVFMNGGMEPAPSSLSESQKFHQNEITKWGEVIKSANIKMQ